MKLGTLLNNLFVRSGGDKADQKLVDLLSKAEIANTEIDDAIATSIEGKLFSEADAKNSPTIKNHFTALALNPLDAEAEKLAGEFGFDDTLLNELKGEKNSYKKIGFLATKVKELEAKKAEAAGKGNSGKEKEYSDKINTLTTEIGNIKTTHQNELKAAKESALNEVAAMKNEVILGGFQYANKELPIDVNITTAQAVLDRELGLKGAKRIYNPETRSFKLVNANDPSLDYMDERNNKPLYEDFAKGVLTQNKLLMVNDTSKQQQVQNQQQQIHTSAPSVQNANYFAAVEASIADQTPSS